MNNARRHRLLLIGTIIIACWGCGDDKPALVPVHGTVLLNDKPMTTGKLTTVTEAAHGAAAFIQPDGTFELKTYESGVGSDGASPGMHKVAVIATEEPASNDPDAAPGKSLIPKRYNVPETSQLTIEVKADGENAPVLKLTSP